MAPEHRARKRFLADVLAGLQRRPRALPCKYFYDARGSELFEAICQCPEYYVTRADLALHEAHLAEISDRVGPQAHVIEFGAGSGVKTRKLLAGLEQVRAYTPIEISASALAAAARDLEDAFPDIEIRPLKADYTLDIDSDLLNLEPPSRRRVVYFPGSTIGNFDHAEALDFLKRMARIARTNGAILIGVDLMKSEQQLCAAYDDAAGITAAFNLNLLERMQRELDAGIDLDAFAHEARFNREESRVEMHLRASRATAIEVNRHRFEFEGGETIHTENSYKYSVKTFRELAAKAGLQAVQVWKDPDGLFSMHWLEPAY